MKYHIIIKDRINGSEVTITVNSLRDVDNILLIVFADKLNEDIGITVHACTIEELELKTIIPCAGESRLKND